MYDNDDDDGAKVTVRFKLPSSTEFVLPNNFI